MLPLRSVPLLAALVVALGSVASAATWRWYDAGGQPHYTNVESHAPAGADRVGGRIGLLSGRVGRMPARGLRGRHGRRVRAYRECASDVSCASWPARSCWATGVPGTYPVTGCQLPSRLWLVDATTQLESRKCGGF